MRTLAARLRMKAPLARTLGSDGVLQLPRGRLHTKGARLFPTGKAPRLNTTRFLFFVVTVEVNQTAKQTESLQH